MVLNSYDYFNFSTSASNFPLIEKEVTFDTKLSLLILFSTNVRRKAHCKKKEKPALLFFLIFLYSTSRIKLCHCIDFLRQFLRELTVQHPPFPISAKRGREIKACLSAKF